MSDRYLVSVFHGDDERTTMVLATDEGLEQVRDTALMLLDNPPEADVVVTLLDGREELFDG